MDPLEAAYDWRRPDVAGVFRERARRLIELRKEPGRLPLLAAYYRDNPADFISGWGVTIDPRVAASGRNPVMPFVLFPRQREAIEWILEQWHAGKPGLLEKSRDVGASWLLMALAVTLCLFRRDMLIGVGSSKEDKIDRSGDPDCLFFKARMFLAYLPPEFVNGWDLRSNSAHMRLIFPATGSSITGEAGDNIGRGGRKAIFFLDESAHIDRPKLIDASLAATTDCRLDVSSVNGMANSFAERRHSGKVPVFTFHWRDDPRKDDDWYAKKAEELDPVTLAQEIDINYTASVEGVIIPAAWVQKAIDAHRVLGIEPTGVRGAALDVADGGMDKNALAVRHGILLEHVESWSGSDDTEDIYETTERAFTLCDLHGVKELDYDGDGLGAGVRGDARKINEQRVRNKLPPLEVRMFRGSASGVALMDANKYVRGPDGQPLDRKNKDMFANAKAQGWWGLRFRFQQTVRALEGLPYDPDDIISIRADIPERARLLVELSQPVYGINKAGKIEVNKTPEGVRSPNLGDAVMMNYAKPQKLKRKRAGTW